MDFTGSRIELRGHLRTEGVSSNVGLWMRQDGEGRAGLAFDNMSGQRVTGTRDWAEYSISLPVRADANQLFFGVMLSGSGKAWADGNVSPFSLPGGMRSAISGIGVFYPDRKPTQRVGIVPDIVVTPTIEGLRSGRDEVLEAALRQIAP